MSDGQLRRLVSQRIREAREARQLTCAEAARRAGMKYHKWRAYEDGKGSPPYDTLADIARVLGVRVSWFLGEDQETARPSVAVVLLSAPADLAAVFYDTARVLHRASEVQTFLPVPGGPG